ncbi:MAG: hypothetical protein VX899_10095 [Myxococcota bacterium]|nr:hypothetical protein [Myxococcota bacterium]
MELLLANLGNMGESFFNHLCDEAGLTPNPVRRDATGWDFLVEIQRGMAPQGVDLCPETSAPLVTCRVQVKATHRSENHVDGISLENWRRLAIGELPAFFVVLRYEGLRPASAYVIHVGPEQCRIVQERLRKAAAEKNPSLRRRTLRLKWGEGDALPEVSGACLKERLVGDVGDPSTYGARKKKWNQEADSTVTQMRFSIDSDSLGASGAGEFFRAIEELALGIRESLPVTVAEVSSTRHGVTLVHPQTPEGGFGGGARLSLSNGPPKVNMEVEFCNPRGTVRATFVWDAIIPVGVFPFLPHEQARVRYLIEGVECVHSLGTGKFDLVFLPGFFGSVRPVAEWWEWMKLLRLVEEGAVEFTARPPEGLPL